MLDIFLEQFRRCRYAFQAYLRNFQKGGVIVTAAAYVGMNSDAMIFVSRIDTLLSWNYVIAWLLRAL